ncbi:MAG: M20/M25/M40 family metallo-hydrolase [Acidobacteriota bacterium]
MWKTAFRLTCLLLVAAQAVCTPAAEESLTEEEVARHLRYLASDELMGRRTGTPGNDQAAAYIASQFERADLKTLPGLEGYLQRIPFELTEKAESGTLSISGRQFAQGDDLIILEGPALKKEVPAIFRPATLADLEELDLQGKLLVAPLDDADNPRSFRTALRRSQARRDLLARKSAAGLVEVYQGTGWERISQFLSRRRLQLASDSEEEKAEPILHALIHQPQEGSAPPWEAEEAMTASIDVPGRLPQIVHSANVAGWVEGSDPQLRGQHVMLMAHYDHLGAGKDLPGATEEDYIFNGARDNGMGVVALISAAKSLANQPPARSVVFLAVTAEEIGLLGSRYYLEHPLVPLEKTVFVLNSDAGGFTDTDVVTVMGLERTTAREDIQKACADFGMEAVPDPVPGQNFFSRSDNIHFARKGVPAPTFSPGFREFSQELMKHYHRPSDEAGQDFDFAYLLRFSQAFARSARRIADNPQQPRWAPGDSFEEAWKQLYGK